MPKPMRSRRNLARLAAATPLAFAGQRIGIMGGTFDPPHAGHAAVAATALRRLHLDQLWWMVSPGNPLKRQPRSLSLGERVEASRTLASDPRIKVTDLESALGSTYTFDTLRYLKRRFPGVHFVWVMGADNLAGFHRWQHWRGIARLMPLAIVDRPRWRLPALASPAARALASHRLPEAAAARLARSRAPAWVFLSTRLSDASSTALRAEHDLETGAQANHRE